MDLKKLEVLLRAADNGYVDLCFFSLIRSGPFEYIDLVDDPMMVVLYPGHPLTKKRAIALEDLKDEPLLLATNPRGLDYDVAKVLSEASFTPRHRGDVQSRPHHLLDGTAPPRASASKRRLC